MNGWKDEEVVDAMDACTPFYLKTKLYHLL